MNITVDRLVPGDVIIGTDADITVERIEGYELPTIGDRVRVHGRITRGYGCSTKVRTWTYTPDQEVDVDRGEARYIFTKSGREVRVR